MLHLEIYVSKCHIVGKNTHIYPMQKWDKAVKKWDSRVFDVKIGTVPPKHGQLTPMYLGRGGRKSSSWEWIRRNTISQQQI